MDPKKLLIICIALLALSTLFSIEYNLVNGIGEFAFNFGGNWRSKIFLSLLVVAIILYARAHKSTT